MPSSLVKQIYLIAEGAPEPVRVKAWAMLALVALLLGVMLFMVMLLLRRWRRSAQLLSEKKPDKPKATADIWTESARRMQVDPDHSDDDDSYRQVDE